MAAVFLGSESQRVYTCRYISLQGHIGVLMKVNDKKGLELLALKARFDLSAEKL